MEITVRIEPIHHIVSGGVDPRIDSLFTRVGEIMASLKDIQDRIAKLTADVAAETSLDQSIITLIQGDAAIIADLKSQLAAAIAANDPAALQAVVDSMDAAHVTMTANAAAAAAAVVAGS